MSPPTTRSRPAGDRAAEVESGAQGRQGQDTADEASRLRSNALKLAWTATGDCDQGEGLAAIALAVLHLADTIREVAGCRDRP